MIDIKFIYDRVVNDLSRKNGSGYTTIQEFNRDLIDSENILYEFYYQRFQFNQKISDALMPFIEEKLLDINGGFVNYPKDHRHPLEMSYNRIKSECGNNEAVQVPMDYLNTNEERDTLISPIRKPNMDKMTLYYTQVNKRLKVLPMELVGTVRYKYLRQPVYGKYVTDIDVNTATEVFNRSKSIDLEWEVQEGSNIINLMLLHKGISVRDNELLQYATTKMGIEGYVRANNQ